MTETEILERRAAARIYEHDGETLVFDATVVGCEERGGGYEIRLDRTAFFPGGGGQNADAGVLHCGGEDIRVLARERGDEVVHTSERPIPVGSAVCGEVDAAPRLSRMQNHTGEHIISGLAHRLFGCENRGFHMSENGDGTVQFVTVDTDRELTEEAICDIETASNESIMKNIPVVCRFPLTDELGSIAYRSKKALTGPVRLVGIDGVDLCACCAPHFGRTGSVGALRIIDSMRYKGGMRLTAVAGMSALRDERSKLGQLALISRALSVKQQEAAEGVLRLGRELEEEHRRAAALEEALSERIVRESVTGVVFEPLFGPAARKKTAQALALRRGGIGAVFSGNDGSGYDYVVALPDGQSGLRAVGQELKRLGGGGGGSETLISGRVKAGRAEILASGILADAAVSYSDKNRQE